MEEEHIKFNLPKLSFITHYRKDSDDREFNLKRILKFLNDNFNAEIIVINDKPDKDEYPTWIEEIVDNLIIFNNNLEYKRCYCLTKAAKESKGDILCFWDSDIMIDPKFIAEAYEKIISGEFDHIYPYNGLFINVEKESFDVLGEKNPTDLFIDRYNSEHPSFSVSHTMSCGGCLLISKESYDKIGGYDERFIGWGYEDNDILQRSSRYNKVGRILDNNAICWHLQHDFAVRIHGNEFLKHNQEIFVKNLL
jgi:predicted glycosyltransferase involved in capsule biosynthesis